MRLAVTGGIAEGKSTVLSYIQEAGIEVVSTDDIAREVFVLDEVQQGLGAILCVEPSINPEQVKVALFSDPDKRHAINRLMHPLILRELERRAAPVVEVPLLLESCIQGDFDRIWVVTCGPEEQLRRLEERTGSNEVALSMVAAQLPSRARLAFADRIVRTNLNRNAVRQYVFEAIRRDLGFSLARS